jgi:hypothetical protein
MKIVLYQTLLFASLLTIQISFLDILFPYFLVPLIVLSAVVIWTVDLGFRQALWYVLPLLILYELLTVGGIHVLSIYGVLLAYATSFFSRRMLIENNSFISFFYAVAIVSSAGLYQWLIQVGLERVWVLPSWQSIGWQISVAVLVFFLTQKVLSAFRTCIDRLRSDQALMIR